MGFFDDLIVPDPPEQPQPEFRELGPLTPGASRPPSDWFLPATVPVGREVGAGPYVRVMLHGFSVWPDCVTVHLAVFARRIRTARRRAFPHHGRPKAGALHVGLLFGDGLRVTTLDGDPYGGAERLSLRPTHGSGGGGFHYTVDLLLSGLPPAGPAELVVQWPDEDVPETHTEIDMGQIIEAASRAVEIWPSLRPPERGLGRLIGTITMSGHGGMMGTATPAVAAWRGAGPQKPDEEDRYAPRAEWPTEDDDWKDLRLIKARLTGGADPEADLGYHGTPLHRAAADGSAEVVAELVRHVGDIDLPDQNGFPPLYAAVRHGRLANAAVLLGAGADPAASLGTGGTVGRLALVTPLASLFEGRPDVKPLTRAERAAQEEADRLIRVFRHVDTDGLGAAFVGGLDEEEVIRRLGAQPEDCPVLDLEREPGPYGTGPGGFDPYDFEEALQYVGVTAVPGGCVISQPNGYLPSRREFLLPLSRGTVAGGVFFNPKGGRYGCVIRDEEVGFDYEFFDPGPDAPYEHWLYRFWDKQRGFTRGSELAFVAGTAGVRPEDARMLKGSPRRWVRVPEED
ncbi:ankyrin repeat domain-containing protein [Actinoallomurus rhizosphaericola]|uniref:ankyrin repeat domain-containing protein n=1 Tax=Actinoallomurus rhizosphaericola TaxID=2952536 RepID=UPI00209266A2|nr:ankyrin repeat domain-containing protein [Actinoallomurus rhizosphaericola]MCO5994817.1 ankyrin repeat domain-containing protein [Actinoallomurus rhizosphaericola]